MCQSKTTKVEKVHANPVDELRPTHTLLTTNPTYLAPTRYTPLRPPNPHPHPPDDNPHVPRAH